MTTTEFLSSIDWVLLGKQKADLVEIIGQRSEALEDLAEDDWQVQSLTGILHLIDGLQDFMDAYLPEGTEPTCDVCGALAEDESVNWCGECGCCVEHCQKFEGCPA
jgi:hypothetical protein